jgi:hypothetical protein
VRLGPWCGWNCQQENRKGSWISDKALVASMETVFIICSIQTANYGLSTSAHEKGEDILWQLARMMTILWKEKHDMRWCCCAVLSL